MIAAEVAVWESLVVVAGGIMAAAVGLSVLAKMPGGRWLYRRLVAEPVRDMVRSIVVEEVHDAVAPTVERQLEPIATEIRQINQAVNMVGPGAPALKDRVGRLESGQERIHGQLSVIREMLESLVGRP